MNQGLCLRRQQQGAGEMAQWLRALASLLEKLGSIPSTLEVAHNHIKVQFQEFLRCCTNTLHSMSIVQRHTQAKHPYTENNFLKDLKCCEFEAGLDR